MWKLNDITFYPCKLMHHVLKTANIQRQQRVSRRPRAVTGSWFVLMDEVFGQRPSTAAAERMERLFSAPQDNPYIISVISYLIY